MKEKEEIIKKYLNEIYETYETGKATETSYARALADFIEEFAETAVSKVVLISQPKKMEVGIPDFIVFNGNQKTVGFIESKDIGANLSKIGKSAQLETYKSHIPNLLLTNQLCFVLYKYGKKSKSVNLSYPYYLTELHQIPEIKHIQAFTNLIEDFLSFVFSKDEEDKIKKMKTEWVGRYVVISKKEFEDVVLPLGFRAVKVEGWKEVVYEKPHNGKEVFMWLLSTIDERTGKSRPYGRDAIRVFLVDGKNNVLKRFGNLKRVGSWRSSLVNAIKKAEKFEVEHCPECGYPLLAMEGDFGAYHYLLRCLNCGWYEYR